MKKKLTDGELIQLARKCMINGNYASSYWTVTKKILDKYALYSLSDGQRLVLEKFTRLK
ncbi:hypothetical protein [Bacillus cereus]|uniref:hypothetical protein n=1 Tax=Bacillus cereus TaxID=1396 RepID=UPI000A9C645B|nr:hypothetical protein [Bacillus cereus]HDR8321332.1 hypothetical protein [Bacillus cereus]HDR8330994.1 hypothetical protein [Bacillus cereus]HDR8336348.1 hypothetical protein [Bacillus cereus]